MVMLDNREAKGRGGAGLNLDADIGMVPEYDPMGMPTGMMVPAVSPGSTPYMEQMRNIGHGLGQLGVDHALLLADGMSFGISDPLIAAIQAGLYSDFDYADAIAPQRARTQAAADRLGLYGEGVRLAGSAATGMGLTRAGFTAAKLLRSDALRRSAYGAAAGDAMFYGALDRAGHEKTNPDVLGNLGDTLKDGFVGAAVRNMEELEDMTPFHARKWSKPSPNKAPSGRGGASAEGDSYQDSLKGELREKAVESIIDSMPANKYDSLEEKYNRARDAYMTSPSARTRGVLRRAMRMQLAEQRREHELEKEMNSLPLPDSVVQYRAMQGDLEIPKVNSETRRLELYHALQPRSAMNSLSRGPWR